MHLPALGTPRQHDSKVQNHPSASSLKRKPRFFQLFISEHRVSGYFCPLNPPPPPYSFIKPPRNQIYAASLFASSSLNSTCWQDRLAWQGSHRPRHGLEPSQGSIGESVRYLADAGAGRECPDKALPHRCCQITKPRAAPPDQRDAHQGREAGREG